MPSPPLIRAACLDDVPAITAIYSESVENGVASYELTAPGLEEMQERFETITGLGYPYLVAHDDEGGIAGYAYASAFRTRPAYRWLVEDSVYLPPHARGRGVGRALLGALVARCADLGFRQMVAVIGGAHPASIAVHRAAGFSDCGTLKATGFKHGRWLDTTMMQIALGDGAQTTPDASVYPGTIFSM